MVCLTKNRAKFIKQTCLDLWGRHISYTKLSKAANFMKIIKEQTKKRFRYYKMDFIFTLRKRINFRRKKKFKKEFLMPRLLYNFYLVISRKNFRKFANRAKNKQGSYIENYLGLIEGRLFMMVYRSHLISNLFMIRYTIEYGIFCVNEKLKSHWEYILKPGDILWFSDKQWEKLFRRDLLLKLRNNVIMWPIPLYLMFNIVFMFVVYFRFPKYNEIVYPAGKIDIQLGNDYHVI